MPTFGRLKACRMNRVPRLELGRRVAASDPESFLIISAAIRAGTLRVLGLPSIRTEIYYCGPRSLRRDGSWNCSSSVCLQQRSGPHNSGRVREAFSYYTNKIIGSEKIKPSQESARMTSR